MKFSLYRLSARSLALYTVVWMAVSFVMMFANYDSQQPVLPQWLSTMLAVALAVPASYYAVNYLVPNYLYKKQIWQFVGLIAALTFSNAVVTYLVSLAVYHLFTGLPMFRSLEIVLSLILAMHLFDFILIVTSCIVKVIADRFFMEQRLLEVETEKISTELNFLRAQVNPHFLFNVMNTIYFQIDRTNTQARSSVGMLAEMMRYQLYECTTDRIDIEQELAYIKNYVTMQVLRMEPDSDIKIFVDKQLSGFHIAPLLMQPLIENAFKHISNYAEASKNKLYLAISTEGERVLVVRITNSYDPLLSTKQLLASGGMGLKNLERRLLLLYPSKHELLIEQQESTYNVTLKLQYHD
ncbi:histidine kinase [Hymenobacter sp. RP-2-7]|uniref:Histidine kinase n=1 Tax=Hymenobacter polaris TaxID=2682546 RepID=A0A7Y0FLA7_9BACT|nr:histidine kinase [Hymenobacter polaris]NML64186.1 histidine kinase [Hymenobacter polaris]